MAAGKTQVAGGPGTYSLLTGETLITSHIQAIEYRFVALSTIALSRLRQPIGTIRDAPKPVTAGTLERETGWRATGPPRLTGNRIFSLGSVVQ